MMEKRYVIVEVNYDNCPIKYMIPHKKGECMPFKCNKCGKHGDTKKQFIKKIEQALDKTDFINEVCSYQELLNKVATFIVEFLGVKE